MAIVRYLAVTAGEMAASVSLPPRIAWMACHFSPYGTGLANLPQRLPPESLLILNARTPICGHDPVLIAAQLEECAERLGCSGVLLDLQRPGQPQTRELVSCLCRMVSVPIAVSECYAGEVPCPVFLPPPPPDEPLETYLESWKGREIWLEAATDGLEIQLREAGAAAAPLSCWEVPETGGFADEGLHCHYQSRVQEDCAVFTLWRTRADLDELLTEAEEFGVTTAVGLYQEFYQKR